MTQVAPISQRIWDMKYRLKDAEGTPLDDTIADTWRRVAAALAEPETEATRAEFEELFFETMRDFKALPAGRILAGAGTDRRVTLFNCFVMGTIPDTMAGIFDSVKEAALTMQQGGGIGYDFSTLRPKGAPVKGVGADASGPLSFMDVWDAMCRTIMSAGSRRGAMMATMRCDHPDIVQFIEAKREPGRLRMFNLSVLVTDAFMDAVKADADWPLMFDGEVYETIKARALWDKIMTSTYEFAEPGVIFIDRINRLNNLSYCETISATNPCVTADTWVHTAEGPRQVRDLFGRPFTARIDGAPHRSGRAGFFATGRKPVYRLTTAEGYAVKLTADHKVMRADGQWVEAADLAPGDKVVLNDHRADTEWPGMYGADEGYLAGLMLGGGVWEDETLMLLAHPGAMTASGEVEQPGVLAVMDRARTACASLPCRDGAAAWADHGDGGQTQHLALPGLRPLVRELGLQPGERRITTEIEQASSAFYRGFLSALFDIGADIPAPSKTGRPALSLKGCDHGNLPAIQRMLARLGIRSTIKCKGRVLSLSGAALHRFADVVGLTDGDKAARLKVLLGSAARPKKATFTAKVAGLEPAGEEDVYDVQIPGPNAFDANGLYVHNCGEQPLPPYGTCLLGSINLAKLVDQPFEDGAHIDRERLAKTVRAMVRMLDNVIDVSKYPLPEQRNEATSKRRIGLGVTGLADALILCGQRYGSEESAETVAEWMGAIEHAAYMASAELARDKGPFPLFDRDKYMAAEHIRALPADVRAALDKHGARNALVTSIAPTGTISLFADNVSSGLEPVFSFSYTRKVLQPDGSKTEEEVQDYAYRLYRELHGEEAELPEAFVSAQDLTPMDHLRVQAAAQRHIDSSISKTINVPEDIDFESFKDVYMRAYEMGCKGCTTYRPNDITGSVLEVKKDDKKTAKAAPAPVVVDDDGIIHLTAPLERPEQLEGNTYKIRWPESDHAMYITVNDVIDDQGRRRPFEVFINSKNMEHFAWTVALTRMISAVFRRGGDITFVVEELKAVFDPRGGHWMKGRYVPSILAAIGDVIEHHMKEIGFLEPEEDETVDAARKKVVNAGGIGRTCPKCNSPTLTRMEGCDTCTSCGYSKCG